MISGVIPGFAVMEAGLVSNAVMKPDTKAGGKLASTGCCLTKAGNFAVRFVEKMLL